MPKPVYKQTTKLSNNIVIYDLETTGANPYIHEPIQIAAIVVDSQTLTPKENGVFGPVLIKPNKWDIVQAKALEVNKITIDQLKADGRDQQIVFSQFCDFCKSFQKKNSKWDAMYSGGFNVDRFDNILMNRMCSEYNYVDKDGSPLLFHPIHSYDLLPILRSWFENRSDGPSGYSLSAICEFFGVTNKNAHDAMSDVQATLEILRRIVGFQRRLNDRYIDKFRGAFGNNKTSNGV
jgi:exonuclease I